MAFFHEDTHRRWIITLQIAGLRSTGGVADRYTSGPATPQPIAGHPGDAYYRDVDCITAEDGLSPLDESLDLLRSLYDAGSVTVRLARLRDQPGDPHRTFSRSGRRAADANTIVTRTVRAGAETPFEMLVGHDLSGLSYPRLVDVGREQMYCTGFDGSSPDPADPDPYRLTVTARAVGGTRLATHLVRAEALDYPILTTGPTVYWNNRPAIITAEPADHSEPPAVIFRGFIAQAPDPDADGSISVVVLPLTAALDQEVELAVPDETTTLTHGYHLFSSQAGAVFEMHQQSPGYRAGPLRAQTLANSNAIDAEVDDVALWSATFDPDRPFGHPRGGDLAVRTSPNRFYKVTSTSNDGGAEPRTFDLADGPDDAVNTGHVIIAREGAESKRAAIIAPGDPDEILVWPGTDDDGLDGAFGRINAALTVADHTGVDGAFVGLRLTGGGQGEGNAPADAVAAFTRNTPRLDRDEDRVGRLVYVLDHVVDELAAGNAVSWPDPRGPRLPAHPSTHRWPDERRIPQAWDADGPVAGILATDVLWFPFVWTRPLEATAAAHYAPLPVSITLRYPLHDLAQAFYQRGEPAVLVDRLLDITDGYVRVQSTGRNRAYRIHDDASGTIRRRAPAGIIADTVDFTAAVSSIDAVVLAVGPRTGDTVYKLTFADPFSVPSFGDFTRDGMESGITISARREDDFRTPVDALVWLLTNQNALGLTADEVDIDSIRRYPSVAWEQPFSLPAVGPGSKLTFRDLVDGILRMVRGALVMRGPDYLGRTRLSLVSTGIAVGSQAVAAITAANVAAEPIPTSTFNPTVCNRVVVNTHYDPVEEELIVDTAFEEKASKASNGAQQGEELNAYGFAPANPPRDLFMMARGIFTTFSEARRRWAFRVSTAAGMRLGVGNLVVVNHPELLDHAGLPAAMGAGQVVERRLDIWQEGCSLVVEAYPVEGAGWGPSLRVTEVIDATRVRVADNAYCDPVNLVDGAPQRDLDGFAVGQTVKCVPRISMGAAVTRNITDITDDVVTFDGAHALVVKDDVWPADGLAASPFHRNYAYLPVTLA